jgi:hypothetical protein
LVDVEEAGLMEFLLQLMGCEEELEGLAGSGDAIGEGLQSQPMEG